MVALLILRTMDISQIAEAAIKIASLDALIFCPAYQAPLRTEPPMFSGEQRLAMVQAVLPELFEDGVLRC